MKSAFNVFLAGLASLVLVACSGGGSISEDGGGGGGGTPSTPDYNVELSLSDSEGNSITEVSKDVPGTLKVKISNDSGTVAQQRVVFSLEGQGTLEIESDVTDSEGIASTQIFAGSQKGAGRVTATVTVGSDSFSGYLDFSTLGDDDGDGSSYQLSLVLENSGGDAISEVSKDVEGLLKATLTNNGVAAVQERVTFSLAGEGALEASSAITSSTGVAQVKLFPGTVKGAGTVTASVEIGGETVNANVNFSTLGDGGTNASPYSLTLTLVNAGGDAISEVSKASPGVLRATLTESGAPVVQKRVQFNLVGDGLLDASSDVTDTNGVAGINVFAGTTKGAGRITGIAQINGQDVEGSVDFSTLGDDAGTSPIDEYSLALVVRDINGDEQREISFQSPGQLVATLSRNGVPVSYERISFTLDGQGQINPSSGTALTNNSGEASVTVLTADTAGTAQLTATFELNGESLSENFNVQIVGDAPGGEGEVNTLTAVLLSSDTGLPTTEISAADPGRVEVTLVDTDSQPLAGKVVTFTSSLGSFLPMQATALTDTLGRANITITAGSVEGAGEITASYQGVDAVVGFVTEGDDIDPVEASPAISFEIYDCNDAPTFSKSLKNFEVCTVTSNITNERPGIVGAVVTRSGSTQPLNQVLVTGATTIGAITPASGTAITDEDGKAVMDVYADGDVGAGELSLKVQEVTSTKAFEIGRVDITLDVQTSLGTNTLPAGGSTIVEVTVFNPDGSLATGQPFSLELTSECVAAGTAVIDSPVVTTAGKGFSTYRADGCEGVDTITVSAITGSSTVTADASVTVDSVDIGSIQYVEANPVQMALRGTGGISGAGSRSETSLVSFKVLDATGQAAPQEKVCFELSTEVGGLTLSPSPLAADYLDCENMPNPGDPEYPADISLPNKYGVGYTNSEGLVTVTVNAGDVPTPVKVFAQWAGSDDQGHDRIISNTSEQLVVSTGITDANSFSLSANILNPEGWNFDGEEIDVTVRAADHFNNLVPAGTRISFRTEGGAIDASCETGLKEGDIPNGTCSVNWVSQNERPFEEVTPVCPNGGFNGNTTPPCTGTTLEGYTDGSNSVLPQPRPGRATITAYAIGEEGFVDLNGNGLYDSTDFRTTADDLGEAFTDHNEDGGYRNSGDPANNGDRDEEFIDYNIDGVYTAGDGLYTGLLCAAGSEAACSDTGSNLANAQLNVFANLPIVMAGSVPYLRLTNIDETTGNISLAQPIDLTVNASETVYLFVSDVNNNTLPFGTTIQASIDNGELAAGSDSSVTIGSNNSNRPLLYSFTVVREANPNQKTVGALVITIKTPQGELVSVSVTVVDAG